MGNYKIFIIKMTEDDIESLKKETDKSWNEGAIRTAISNAMSLYEIDMEVMEIK